jgi:histone-lysine N-methyltransferase SETMAR
LDGLGLHFFAPKWIPHGVSDTQKVDRVEGSQHMLEMMQAVAPKQQKYPITGDESWIYWDNQRRGIWAQDRVELTPNVKRMISSKRTMVSVYFSRWGFVSVEFLPMEQKYNSQFFTETVTPRIEQKLAGCPPKLRTTTAHLRLDNAKLHAYKMFIEKIEELGFILVPQPPFSPDLAPCDFFPFGYLKQHLEEKHFTKEDQFIAAITEVYDKIPLQTFQNVMDDWRYRLRKCIQLGGEDVLQLKNEIAKVSPIRQFRLNRTDFWTTL